MQRKSKAVCSAAALFAMTIVGTARAETIAWTYGGTTAANLKWETASSWSATPDFDGTEDITFSTNVISPSSNRTLTLNGDRYINSLTATTVTVGRTFVLTAGTPSGILKIQTGNITIDGGGVSSGQPLSLAGVTVQIGDEVAPVTTAIWDLKNSNTTVASYQLGAIRGIAGTVVTIQGDNPTVWNASSDSYLGTFILQQSVKSGGGGIKAELNASNAMGGAGSLVVANGTGGTTTQSNLHFNSVVGVTATTHSMNVRVDTRLGIAVGIGGNNADPGFVSKATLNGNLTGAGSVDLGAQTNASTAFNYGLLVLAGSANTQSGGMTIRNGGRLQVDGTWTGAGDFTVTRGLLSGSGSIGLAASKKVDVASSAGVDATNATVAPGAVGVVGTLTLGTLGNSNSVNFNKASAGTRQTQLLIDLDGATSDQLIVNGDITVGGGLTGLSNSTYLVFNQLSTLTASTFVLARWTGTLTGTFSNITALPANGSVVYDLDNKQLLLQLPEPSMLCGVLLGAAGLLRRRGRGDRLRA